jgi:hypothetical protein
VDCCGLYFYPLNSDKYVDSRFVGNELKATEIKKWIEQHGLSTEVKGNPLLLNLIVLLASVSDSDRTWMSEYGILEYDKIKTTSDLYENVVKFVLAKHSKEIKNQDFDPDEDLTSWMKRLGEYAFELFSNNSEKNNKKYFDAHLSILFKSEENGEYHFIHKSFYEFFLVKYLVDVPQGNDILKNYIQSSSIWADSEIYKIILLYVDNLLNNPNHRDTLSVLIKKLDTFHVEL